MARSPQGVRGSTASIQSAQPAPTPGGAPGILMGFDEEQRAAQLPPLVPQEQVRRVAPKSEPEPEAAPIQQYRVRTERRIMHRGSMVMLRAGKVIDERNYNVRDLMGQGVVLDPIEA